MVSQAESIDIFAGRDAAAVLSLRSLRRDHSHADGQRDRQQTGADSRARAHTTAGQVAGLVFAEAVTITLLIAGAGIPHHFASRHRVSHPPVGLRKNDCCLGPFFSDAGGTIGITRRAVELNAQAERDTGLMDYIAVSDCGPTSRSGTGRERRSLERR